MLVVAKEVRKESVVWMIVNLFAIGQLEMYIITGSALINVYPLFKRFRAFEIV